MSQPEHSPSRRSGQLPSTTPGRSARGVRVTWWYTYASMVFFALFMAFIGAALLLFFHEEAGGRSEWPVAVAAVLIASSGLAHAACSWLVRHGMGRGWPRPWATVLLAAPAGIAWVLTLWVPGGAFPGGVSLWISVNILAILVRGMTRRVVFAVGIVLFVLHWWAGSRLTGVSAPTAEAAQQLPGMVFFVIFVPVVFLFSAWWWDIVVQLDAARRDAAQLAVARERLRFASDLHDIQGHHLQVIALKAELAERLLGAGKPETAQANIHEVRTLARTALEETRSLVRDLREVSLEEELANARDVLAASGAAVSLHGIHVQDPTARTLLGLAVREGATNILRHAPSATKVSIVLEAAGGAQTLVMSNNGVESPKFGGGGGGTGTGAPGAAGPASGTGLSGLSRRFQASGGSVAGRRDGGTYVLEARLPFLPPEDTVRQGTPLTEETSEEREKSA
ncbi:MAG: sensor histidine kinase [Citricoccus sp.]